MDNSFTARDLHLYRQEWRVGCAGPRKGDHGGDACYNSLVGVELRVRKNSKIIAERLSRILFVPTHEDSAPADRSELLFENVSALSLLLAPPLLPCDLPSSHHEIPDAHLLQDGALLDPTPCLPFRPGVGGSSLLAVKPDVDLLQRSADGVLLESAEVGVLFEVALDLAPREVRQVRWLS